MGSELLHTDRRMDRHDEAKSRFRNCFLKNRQRICLLAKLYSYTFNVRRQSEFYRALMVSHSYVQGSYGLWQLCIGLLWSLTAMCRVLMIPDSYVQDPYGLWQLRIGPLWSLTVTDRTLRSLTTICRALIVSNKYL